MTPAELKACMPHATGANCAKFAAPISDAMGEFQIETPLQQAYFIAQVAHESGSLQYVREIATGGAYEGRKDLGNTEPGDGIRYKGRGLIQVTGRHNYDACGQALGIDCIGNPELLEAPEAASRSAAWFWQTHNLNASADADDIRTSTRIINGGFNGLLDRQQRLAEAKRGMGVS